MSEQTPTSHSDYLKANQKLWDSWTRVNAQSKFYDVDAFKAGKNTLSHLDIDALGDVHGKRLLHLQCHFGLDTLSWARQGAEVTGLDFSAEGIATARQLAEDLDIPAQFVNCNLYDAKDCLDGQFDIVYTSAGILGWLPDIARWGDIAAHFVKPGGQFRVREVHPLVGIFDDIHKTSSLDVIYDYFHAEQPLHYVERGSYAEPDADIENDAYYWLHSLSDIFTSLLEAGLTIREFTEYPYLDWQNFEFMVENDEGDWQLPPGMPSIPLMFALTAEKPHRP